MKHVADAIAKMMAERGQQRAKKYNKDAPIPEEHKIEVNPEHEKNKLQPEDVSNVAAQLCPHCGAKLKSHMAEKAALPAHSEINE